MNTYSQYFHIIQVASTFEKFWKALKKAIHSNSVYLRDYGLRLIGYYNKGKPAENFTETHWGKVFRSSMTRDEYILPF